MAKPEKTYRLLIPINIGFEQQEKPYKLRDKVQAGRRIQTLFECLLAYFRIALD